MQLEIDVLLDYYIAEPADVLLQLEVAQMTDQRLVEDRLTVTSQEPLRPEPGEDAIGQRTWALGHGSFRVEYQARVALDRATPPLAGLAGTEPRFLPGLVIPYLMPSRYVESDRFETFVHSRFGRFQGGDKVLAMLEWVAREMTYTAGASDTTTTAASTFVERHGVCRDYAHLLAAFARAGGVPARMLSGYAPKVAPPDFHALVEVWLDDGWHIVDATGMAHPDEVARISIGRDATDIAFMTVFGAAALNEQRVAVRRVD